MHPCTPLSLPSLFSGCVILEINLARNRMIKPEFFSDEKVAKLPFEARLLFIGLWNFSDDCGVHPKNYRTILGEIFPNDESIKEKRVEKWVELLLDLDFLVEIDYNSGKFLKIKNWGKHQKVPNPSEKQWIPEGSIESLITKKLDSNLSQITKDKDKDKDKDKAPTLEDFLTYCKTLKIYHSGLDFQIEAKYNAWKEAGWIDGNGKKIKNWKTKIQNTIPYFKNVQINKGNSGYQSKLADPSRGNVGGKFDYITSGKEDNES